MAYGTYDVHSKSVEIVHYPPQIVHYPPQIVHYPPQIVQLSLWEMLRYVHVNSLEKAL